MAILVEVDTVPQQNDVIVYRGGKWCATHRADFFFEVHEEMNEILKKISVEKGRIDVDKENIAALEAEMENLKASLAEFAEGINTKLKEHHDVLQVLVGGNK